MSSLTPEQRQNIRKLKAAAQRYGASPRELKALLEAASVESNFRHLSYGDRDSQGILQQRPSAGWGSNESVETDAGQFLTAARKVSSGGFKGSAGKLAQAVQRSAFPGRYDERAGLADQLAGGSSYSGSSPTSSTPTTADPEARQRLLLAYLSDRHNPDALLQLGYGLKNLPQPQAPAPSTRGSGTKPAKLLELFYDPAGLASPGRDHYDHVHVAAAHKSLPALMKAAGRYGLTITSVEGGKHAPHSYHYRGMAFDAAGDPKDMAAFARHLARAR